MEGLQSAFVHSRLSFAYIPSFFEWQLTFGVIALGGAIFYLGCRLLPILSPSGPGGEKIGEQAHGKHRSRIMKRRQDKAVSISSRRKFLAGGALLGTGMIPSFLREAAAQDAGGSAVMNNGRPDAPYESIDPENFIYSSCLQCNTGCGIKCKLDDGILTKVDGNPYNPWTLFPHLDFQTGADDAAIVDGSICPKGQAGLQTAYDPYRLRKVLKRAGKRGENKWTTIAFERAIEEICEGGSLFNGVPGEENRRVEGLRAIMALTDADAAKAMEADVAAIWSEKDPEKKRELVEAFKVKHAEHLDKLIDPEHPDFGPKNNQVVVAWGRLKDGRGDFYKRLAAGLGTTNAHGHTTVCQGSLYFTCKAISEQYAGGKFTGGQKFYWQADTENSRFILFVGANLFEANYGPPNRAVRLTDNIVNGRTKIAVADPRFSKLASKAWKWLPVKPGMDAPLALGMTRWMFDNDRYDARFLACANKAAALAVGESSWCNGTWLVEIEAGRPGKFVRAADAGLVPAETRLDAAGVDLCSMPKITQPPSNGRISLQLPSRLARGRFGVRRPCRRFRARESIPR